MKTGFEFNSRKVWEFVEIKPFELSQKPISIHMPSKYIFETYIGNNPIILQRYSDFDWSGSTEEHINETQALARLQDGSRLSEPEKVPEENQKLPTYYDIKYAQSSKIFEAELVAKMDPAELQEAEKSYGVLLEKLKKGEEVDEGFLGSLALGAGGFLLGPTIGKAICTALGIHENGVLGTMLTSRLVTTALGLALGKR